MDMADEAVTKKFKGGFYGQETTTASKTKPKSKATATTKTKSIFYKESISEERSVLISAV